MGRLQHPAGEGRLETKEKAPIAECLPQMGSLRIHPPLCFFNRRWYACKQRRWRYYPVLPISRKSRIVGTLLSAQIPSGILHAYSTTKVNRTRADFYKLSQFCPSIPTWTD